MTFTVKTIQYLQWGYSADFPLAVRFLIPGRSRNWPEPCDFCLSRTYLKHLLPFLAHNFFYVPSSKVRFPFGFSSYSGTLSLLYQETCSSYSCSALPKFPELSTLELPLNCSSSSIYGNTRVNFCLPHPGLERGQGWKLVTHTAQSLHRFPHYP